MCVDIIFSIFMIMQKPFEILGWEPVDLHNEVDLTFVNKILPYQWTFTVMISDAFVADINLQPGFYLDSEYKGDLFGFVWKFHLLIDARWKSTK